MVRICLKVFGLRGEVNEATFRQEFILECFIKPRRKHENRRAGVGRGSVRLSPPRAVQCLSFSMSGCILSRFPQYCSRQVKKVGRFPESHTSPRPFIHFLISIIISALRVINIMISVHCNRNWAQDPFSIQVDAIFTLWNKRKKAWEFDIFSDQTTNKWQAWDLTTNLCP